MLAVGPAERYDVRLRPPASAISGDTFDIVVEWNHWITQKTLGRQKATVRVI
jgi:hypothetical protein